MTQLKRYQKAFSHSYSFGVFPTLELLTHKPEQVLRVVAHTKGAVSNTVSRIRARCDELGVPFEVNDKLVDKLSHKGNVYVFAVFQKYQTPISNHENHVVLVNPSDMGNLGSVIRTMLGFNMQDLVLLAPAADVFNPQVVRASMGGLFALRIETLPSLTAYRQRFSHTLYPFMLGGRRKLGEVTFTPPFTLVFGPEGSGLSADYAWLGESVTIAQSPLIESFNLAVAVGIALYEVTRHEATRYEATRYEVMRRRF